MTIEELVKTIQEISEQIDKLSDAPDKPLTKQEKNRKIVLQLQKQTLERMKEAKEKGHLQQEINAGMDYALLREYGEKHPLLMHFIKTQLRWYGW